MNNEYENTIIRTLDTTNEMWIGLRSTGQNISWSDGSLVSYTKWAAGQPDSLNELCATYSINFSSSWYARMCTLLYKSVCQITLFDQGKVRLEGNTESSGIVQITNNGLWGDVCAHQWDLYDATVVCKELGYSGVINYQTF
ncbi:lectin-like protein, partial [Salmonella sp. s51228]|uniref:lectin-like protein n=1 Tax=Salmonella sp. s51228 TaxID=3159652 RepID=UPI0039813CD7